MTLEMILVVFLIVVVFLAWLRFEIAVAQCNANIKLVNALIDNLAEKTL